MHLLEDIEHGPDQGIKKKIARCGKRGKSIHADDNPEVVTCGDCLSYHKEDRVRQLEETIAHRLLDLEGISEQITSYRRELKELKEE